MLRDRITILQRVATMTAIGETVTWVPVEKRYARVVPMNAKARAIYQQMQSHATHVVTLRDDVSLSLGDYRILWKDKTLDPTDPPTEREGVTTIAVEEI